MATAFPNFNLTVVAPPQERFQNRNLIIDVSSVVHGTLSRSYIDQANLKPICYSVLNHSFKHQPIIMGLIVQAFISEADEQLSAYEERTFEVQNGIPNGAVVQVINSASQLGLSILTPDEYFQAEDLSLQLGSMSLSTSFSGSNAGAASYPS